MNLTRSLDENCQIQITECKSDLASWQELPDPTLNDINLTWSLCKEVLNGII